MSKKGPRILIVATLVVVGGGLAAFGWRETTTRQRLAQSGLIAHGRVIDHSIGQNSRRSSSYSLTVEFAPSNQPAVTRTFSVDGNAYHPAVKSGTVEVRYLPQDPSVAVADDVSLLPFQIVATFGGIVLLAGILLLPHLWRRPTTDGPRP